MLLCEAAFFCCKCCKKSLETKRYCAVLAPGLLHPCLFGWRRSLLNILGLSVLIMCMYHALQNGPWGGHPGSTDAEIIRNGHNIVAHFCLWQAVTQVPCRRTESVAAFILPRSLSLVFFWNLLNTTAELQIPSFFEMPFQDFKRRCGSYWTSLKGRIQRQVLLSMQYLTCV